MLHEAEELAATRVDPSMGRDAIDALKLKNLGIDEVKRLRSILFPEDDRG